MDKDLYLISKARTTALEMLSARGYIVPPSEWNMSRDHLAELHQLFMAEPKKRSPVMDIHIHNRDAQAYIGWCLPDKRRLSRDIPNILEQFRNATHNDDVVVILLGTEPLQEDYYKYESDNVTIFSLATLGVNITHHRLVPQHSILNSSTVRKLFYKLSIHSGQLPQIQRFVSGNVPADPIARFYGARVGDVMQIIRHSPTSGTHTVYREVVGDEHSAAIRLTTTGVEKPDMEQVAEDLAGMAKVAQDQLVTEGKVPKGKELTSIEYGKASSTQSYGGHKINVLESSITKFVQQKNLELVLWIASEIEAIYLRYQAKQEKTVERTLQHFIQVLREISVEDVYEAWIPTVLEPHLQKAMALDSDFLSALSTILYYLCKSRNSRAIGDLIAAFQLPTESPTNPSSYQKLLAAPDASGDILEFATQKTEWEKDWTEAQTTEALASLDGSTRKLLETHSKEVQHQGLKFSIALRERSDQAFLSVHHLLVDKVKCKISETGLAKRSSQCVYLIWNLLLVHATVLPVSESQVILLETIHTLRRWFHASSAKVGRNSFLYAAIYTTLQWDTHNTVFTGEVDLPPLDTIRSYRIWAEGKQMAKLILPKEVYRLDLDRHTRGVITKLQTFTEECDGKGDEEVTAYLLKKAAWLKSSTPSPERLLALLEAKPVSSASVREYLQDTIQGIRHNALEAKRGIEEDMSLVVPTYRIIHDSLH